MAVRCSVRVPLLWDQVATLSRFLARARPSSLSSVRAMFRSPRPGAVGTSCSSGSDIVVSAGPPFALAFDRLAVPTLLPALPFVIVLLLAVPTASLLEGMASSAVIR
jgi:hypothetical protein